MKQSNKPVRAGIIGVSGYGGTHLRALEGLRGAEVEIVAATIINQAMEPEKCARLKRYGCRIYDDYREMLEKEEGRIDLCCIPTGIPWHCEMTVAALQAGCHVLVEKPAAGTIQEVDEMIRVRDASNRQVAVGFQHLYLDEYLMLKKHLADGGIGSLREIRVRIAWPRPVAYYARNEWAGRLSYGDRWVLDSPANNACAHFLMAALHFSGRELFQAASPEKITAELYRTQDIDSFDTIVARITTDTGISIFFAASHSSVSLFNPLIQLRGDRGEMTLEFGRGINCIRNGAGPGLSLPAERDARNEMVPSILEQIRGVRPEVCPLEEARKHTHLINSLHEAIPISDIAGSSRAFRETSHGMQWVIPGFDDVLEQAFRSGRLFSEMDVPWAVPSTTSVVRPMREFLGPLPQDVSVSSQVSRRIAALRE